jgi:flagellar hook protein FlgE
MLRSLTSAISGLQNFQERMDVIGNNIANVNTTGFKAARVEFADSFSQTLRSSSAGTENSSSTSAMQIGSGVSTAAIRNLYTQGAITGTNIPTDLAIAGEGYFVVRDTADDSQFVTRSGDFRLDNNGYLVTNAGMRVQGYNDSGLDDLGDIKIDLDGMLAEATPPAGSSDFTIDSFSDFTSFATGLKTPADDVATYLSGRLSAGTQALLGAWDPADPLTPAPDGAIEQAVMEDLNSVVHGSLIWNPDPAANPFAGVTLRPETSELLDAGLDGEKLARLNRMILEDAYSAEMTQNALPSLSSYAIDSEGRLNLNLSDGSQFTRGQILLQTFRDPQVLIKEGNNLFSGIGLAGGLEAPVPPGTPGVGSIQSGALELSNVDLANEFSSMITAQRGFQATARIISASDEMIQELVNLKR